MADNQWTNDDGLTVWYGEEQASRTSASWATVNTDGPYSVMVVDINYDDLPTFTTDLNNDGTKNGFNNEDVAIPAGSLITRAHIIVETAFAGGTSYNIGLYQTDGTVIDADGIDAAVATAALAANLAVQCDGALVGGTALVQNDAHLVVAATGTFTAGKAKLVVEYVQVDV